MRVLLVWPDCDLLNGTWADKNVDSFWVECTLQEAAAKILPRIPENKRSNWWPTSVDHEAAGKRYFLVAKDLSSINEMASFYPYSGQWNAYCPFRQLPEAVSIEDLEELQHICIPRDLRG